MLMDGQTKTTSIKSSDYNLDWWRHAVIYRLNVANFADGDDDNVGDLHGLIDHLDYLASLNIDAVQLIGVTNLPDSDALLASRRGDAGACSERDYLCQLVLAAEQRKLWLLPDFAEQYLSGRLQPLVGLRRPAQLLQHLTGQLQMDDATTINPFIIEDISLPRLTAQFGSTTYRTEIAKMFATVQLTWAGTPCLYQGQELGLVDHAMIPWGYDPDSDLYAVSVATQEDDATSILNFYRQMINLRKSSLILQDGPIQLVQDNRAVLCYLRGYGDQGILVVANLSHRPVEARTPLVGRLLTSTYAGRSDLSDRRLAPYEALVMMV